MIEIKVGVACLTEKRRAWTHFRSGAALVKLSLSTLALIAAAAALATPAHAQNYPFARSITAAPWTVGRIVVSSAMSSAWPRPEAWAVFVTGTRNTCRARRGAKLSVVRVLQFSTWRCHELRLGDI